MCVVTSQTFFTFKYHIITWVILTIFTVGVYLNNQHILVVKPKPQNSNTARVCTWLPVVKNGSVIYDSSNEECKGLVRAVHKRFDDEQQSLKYLFLGDSTMSRLWRRAGRIGQYKSTLCPANIETSRCEWLEKFKIERTQNWTAPTVGREGPVRYGLENPYR